MGKSEKYRDGLRPSAVSSMRRICLQSVSTGAADPDRTSVSSDCEAETAVQKAQKCRDSGRIGL
jgi:hypothetical protein